MTPPLPGCKCPPRKGAAHINDLLKLVNETSPLAILLVASLLLLPCLSKIVDSLSSLFFNHVLLLFLISKWSDIRKGDIFIKSDFRGTKLEIGKGLSMDDKSTLNDEEDTEKSDKSTSDNEKDAKEEALTIGLGNKVIDLKRFL